MPLYWVTEEEAKLIRFQQSVATWFPSLATDCVQALNQTRETRARPFSLSSTLPHNIRPPCPGTPNLSTVADLFSDVEQYDQRVTHVIMSCSWAKRTALGSGAVVTCLEHLRSSPKPVARQVDASLWGATLWLVDVELPEGLLGFVMVCAHARDLTAPQQSSFAYLLDN